MNHRSPLPWSAQRRLDFIDFRLQWEGGINRGDLMDFFHISAQQASADVSRYTALAPNNLAYDKSLKTYRAAAGFQPLSQLSAGAYLDQLAATAAGGGPESASYIGWKPPVDVVRHPTRQIPNSTLGALLAAIRTGSELQLVYQSMREGSPKLRWVAPHALGSDGRRWHARAWCHETGAFEDFVISRISRILDQRPTQVDFTQDRDWHEMATMEIAPSPALSADQRIAVETEFGMVGGTLSLRCRRALAPYLLRQMNLDPQVKASQPLVLKNPKDCLGLLTKEPESNAVKNRQGDMR